MVSLLAVLCFVALLSMPMVLFAPTELQHPFCQAVVLVALVSAVVLVLWWQWDKHVLRGLKAAEDERETNVHQTRFSNADAEKSKRAQKAEGRILMAKFGPLVEFLKGPHQEWNSAEVARAKQIMYVQRCVRVLLSVTILTSVTILATTAFAASNPSAVGAVSTNESGVWSTLQVRV